MTRLSAAIKMQAVTRKLEGNESYKTIADSIGAGESTVREWVRNFESMGEAAFYSKSNHHYTYEEKERAVQYYLVNKGSQDEICKLFKIKSRGQLRQWVKEYQNNELKASPNRNQNKGRKTTLEERIAIVEDHIKSNSSYSETAFKHDISYGQARRWHMRYMENGIEGLVYRRGKLNKVK